MKAMARIALALVALMTISGCVLRDDGGRGGGDRGGDRGGDHGGDYGHDRGYYR